MFNGKPVTAAMKRESVRFNRSRGSIKLEKGPMKAIPVENKLIRTNSNRSCGPINLKKEPIKTSPDENKLIKTNSNKSPAVITKMKNKKISRTAIFDHNEHNKPIKTQSDNNQPIRISFNVSGHTYETFRRTLQRYPDTLMGNPKSLDSYFCKLKQQYVFDNHSRHAFEAILFFYQSNGKLSRPSSVSIESFETECQFFHLPEIAMATMRTNEGRELLHNLRTIYFLKKTYENNTLRIRLWNLLENPYSSSFAMKMIIFQITTICVSIIVNCIETIPGIRGRESNEVGKNPWLLMELILTGWFLFEFLVRAMCTPNWKRFVTSLLNWIDLFGIPPYLYINFHTTDGRYLKVLHIFRFFRALRVFRLVKCSRRLKAIVFIFQDSLKDLQLFFVCLFIIVVFGASVLYFLEKDARGTAFVSVPDSMWWGVQTFLTLGYGDIVPTTPLGKLFSSIFMVFGVTTMSLPVLSLIMKFSAYSKVS